ncbi:MAG TPA: DNA mismatch repair protein MutS [Verrucomicrobiae bacterium]|nr:DNA mismatch repair protein MutS [Verrucomicrobiae bacterium]
MQTLSAGQGCERETAVAVSPPSFHSILFDGTDNARSGETVEPPDFFRDLNLDQIVDAITDGRDEYNLKPFFYSRLTDLGAIEYRQQVMRDIEGKPLFDSIKSFSKQMRAVRERLTAAEKLSYKYEQEAWLLDAAELYCESVAELRHNLDLAEPSSRGLLSFRTFLTQYTESDRFQALLQEAKAVKSGLAAIVYCLLIKGGSVTVCDYEAEPDYSVVVEETFAKFKQGAVKDYRVRFPSYTNLNHVEAAVLDRVALLNPDAFRALDGFSTKNGGFLENTIVVFDREIQFYIAYLDYAETFKRNGLKFCHPRVSDTCQNISNREGFDLALAGQLIREKKPVVCNDFSLSGKERIFVVSGPNQGGKTTFARTFGQLHYLASLGCPVPGSEAQLFLFDRLFTHFERREDIATLRGKLKDDLVRIHQILTDATPNSIIVINEMVSSTTVKDAICLTRKVLETISQLDLLCVCVTFLDELASLNEKTVSVVAGVVPDNPTLRTYKIERRPADGLAYALAIAEKYRVTYDRLKERVRSRTGETP